MQCLANTRSMRLKSGRNFRHVPLPLVHGGIPPCESI
nr:MAG TPA: hypothetical protein [Caudoviricetes sp.]